MSDESNFSKPEITGSRITLLPTLDPRALDLLMRLLHENDGSIASKTLKSELVKLGIENPDTIFNDLKFRSGKTWVHSGRSFFTPEAHQAYLKESEKQIKELAETAEAEPIEPEFEDVISERRQSKQEETRLCRYVQTCLEEVYDSDHVPDNYVFDVHSERPSGEYRNVDLIAIDWRSPEHFELITVEVKLDFTPKLIQQAASYLRFSHRVWIAVSMDSATDPTSAASALRAKDTLLFDHCLELGIGIIACRRAKGSSYECFPVQWPRLQRPSELEKTVFLECYRNSFEMAEVLQKQRSKINVRSVI